MKLIERIAEKIRSSTEDHGYTCDHCGAEIFCYPIHRLCQNCEDAMPRIGKKACEKCGRERVTDGICRDCKANAPKFTKGIMPFVYQDQAASMINRMKINAPTLSLFFGEEMARTFVQVYDGDLDAPFLVIPVPMTEKAKKSRGYNQSERLAKAFCKELAKLGIETELEVDVLQKRRETAQQKHMSFHDRAENVSGAYHVHKRTACKGRRILLIDDIMTTGSTASECAKRLLGAGALSVHFLAATALSERK